MNFATELVTFGLKNNLLVINKIQCVTEQRPLSPALPI